MAPPDGGLVASVAPGSIAEECGIQPGDVLVSLDGHQLRDVIDYRFWSAAPALAVLFRRGEEEHEVAVEKEWDDDLGVQFESPLFDRIRTCRNNCVFCFLKNQPRGLRKSLYIKDDDYRLSFLFGNFITLSNLSEADLDRIEQQRLSPLYVSVHSTERELRNRLLGVTAPDILEQLDQLGQRRVEIHAQVVLCPGLNDGDALERTIEDLATRNVVVQSIAVVPVGLTRFCQDPELRIYQPEEANRMVSRLIPLQRRFQRGLGRTLLHISDELYVIAGLPVPPASWYDGFPQLENGVGLVRRLLQGWANSRRRLPTALPQPRRVGWVCGTAAYPTLRRLADDMSRVDGLQVEVVPVENEFFGSTVTVSGLLVGSDVIRATRGRRVDGWVLPRVMFDGTGELALDGVSFHQICCETPDPIATAVSPNELMLLSLYGSAPCAG